MDIFCERLKLLRSREGLTQRQIADVIKTTERGYRNYEIGQSKPNYETLLTLANYFDVSIDYLVGRTSKCNSHKV